jgi:hypothetical protein
MEKHPVRKSISDEIWAQLEPALSAARHSAAGAPGELLARSPLIPPK